MKQIKFETDKGEFLLIDKADVDTMFSLKVLEVKQTYNLKQVIGYLLKEITEEQASQIVDEYRRGYKNYTWRDPKLGGQQVAMVIRDYYNRSVDSLYSLFDSKDLYLFENPHPRRYVMAMTDKGIIDTTEKLYLEAEEKTFYNPYIFKL